MDPFFGTLIDPFKGAPKPLEPKTRNPQTSRLHPPIIFADLDYIEGTQPRILGLGVRV